MCSLWVGKNAFRRTFSTRERERMLEGVTPKKIRREPSESDCCSDAVLFVPPIKFDYYRKTWHRAKPAPCKVFFLGNNDGILHQCDQTQGVHERSKHFHPRSTSFQIRARVKPRKAAAEEDVIR